MTEPRVVETIVPKTVAELSPYWFREILGDRLDAGDCRILEVIEGTCTKVRVALGAANGTMLLKGGFAPHSPAFLGMHLTEMRWYRDIAFRAGFDVPGCHAAVLDPDSGRSAVLLEDLSARGVRWLNALDPLGWRDETAFVDALAAFAGRWWSSPDLEPGGRLDWVIDSYSAEAADYIEHYLAPASWAGFLRLPRCACLPRRLHDRAAMRAALEFLKERLGTQPATLSHGDTHPGNLYLNPDGSPGFLDAQPRRAPWVKDFAYQMVAALDIEDRRRWERPLLARYLRKLAAAGVSEVPSFDEAWIDYRCEILYGLFIFMINESHFQREEVNTACTARFGAAAMDHDSFGALR